MRFEVKLEAHTIRRDPTIISSIKMNWLFAFSFFLQAFGGSSTYKILPFTHNLFPFTSSPPSSTSVQLPDAGPEAVDPWLSHGFIWLRNSARCLMEEARDKWLQIKMVEEGNMLDLASQGHSLKDIELDCRLQEV